MRIHPSAPKLFAAPQQKSPEAVRHRDIGVFSYDTERNKTVLRELMGERVVLRSPCEITGVEVGCDAEHVEKLPVHFTNRRSHP